MINCLTPLQKFFAILWAATGFAMVISALAIQYAITGVLAPDAVADGLGNAAIPTILIVVFAYVGLSMTQRGELEFLDKLYCVFIVSAFNNARATGRVNRWIAERQLIENWEEYVGRTGCAVNFENLCAYLYDAHDIEVDELQEWRRLGTARKALTDSQTRQIIKAVSESVEIG